MMKFGFELNPTDDQECACDICDVKCAKDTATIAVESWTSTLLMAGEHGKLKKLRQPSNGYLPLNQILGHNTASKKQMCCSSHRL